MIKSKFISAVIEGGARILTIISLGKSGVRTPEESMPFGYDGNPIANMKAIYASTTNDGPGVIVGYINVNQLADKGEARIFSVDGHGNEQARIWIHANGDVELGGTGPAGSNANHAVQWEALNTKLADYFTAQNAAITTSITGLSGAYSPPAPIDITTAKLTKIKVQ